MSSSKPDDHWLVRPKTIKVLWWIFSVVLALIVLAQAVIYVKGYFGVDGWFGFGAVYGFVSCLAMVLFAKALGYVLKRPEDYYSGQGSANSDKAGSDKVDTDKTGTNSRSSDKDRSANDIGVGPDGGSHV